MNDVEVRDWVYLTMLLCSFTFGGYLIGVSI
jgi:hypothetical protein